MQNQTFKLAGDGLWGAEAGRTVTISSFTGPDEFDGYTVEHTSTWDVYTDSAFVAAAREFTGIADLDFTEQGMQQDGVASMEV
jgi:hypothetical protein